MDKWTKIVCLLLALVLTGCSVSRYESSEPAVQQIRQKTTVRLVLTEPDATLLRHAAEEFQQQNDKVTIEIETLPDDAEFPVKIISKLYGEQSPTAFSVHGQTDLTFWRDKLEPVGELSWLHPLKDDLLGPVTQGEAVFGIPLRLTGYGIIYNEPLLDSLEIDHGQIGTGQGLINVVDQVNAKLDTVDLKTAVCARADLADILVSHSLNTSAPNQLTVSRHLEPFLQTVADSAAASDPVSLLANREAAIAVGSSDLVSQVAAINPSVAASLRLAPVAIGGQNLVVGCSYLAVYNQADKAQREALEVFLEWLYYSDRGKAILQEQGVLSPYTNTAASQLQSSVYSSLHNGNYQVSTLSYAPNGWRSTCFDTAYEEVLSKQVPLEDFLEKIEAGWSSARDF